MLKIIKPAGTKKEPEEKTFAEIFEMMGLHLKSIENRVSNARTHAVDSQLRACIRLMGYRVRETASKPADIPELLSQCQQALKILNGVPPEKSRENLALYVLAVHSNLEAEACAHASIATVPEMPEVPDESPQTSKTEDAAN